MALSVDGLYMILKWCIIPEETSVLNVNYL